METEAEAEAATIPPMEARMPTDVEVETMLQRIGSIVASSLREDAPPPTALLASVRAMGDDDVLALASLLTPPKLDSLTILNVSNN